MVEGLTLYILLFTILGLIVAVLFVLRGYLEQQHKLDLLTKQTQYFKNQDTSKTDHILDEAHNRAMIILDEANKKASEILSQATAFDQTSKTQLKEKMTEAAVKHSDELMKASQELLLLYKDALHQMQKTDTDISLNISKNVEQTANQELSKFSTLLAKETIESEKIVQKKLQDEYAKLEEQLKAYKESRVKEIDNEILQIVQTVTETILQKQLSVTDQQQLVYEALQEAKSQSMR